MNEHEETSTGSPAGPPSVRSPVMGIMVFLAAVPAFVLSSYLFSLAFGLLAGSALAQILFFALFPVLALRVLRAPKGIFHLSLPGLGCRAVSWILVPVVVLLFFQYEMVQEAYLYSSQDRLRTLYEETFQFRTAPFALVLVSVGILPAFCEEILFRGVLLGSARALVGAPAAVAVSSVLFAMVHPIPVVLLPIFLLGLLLGTLTVLSGSILPAAAVHFINNFLVVLFLTNPDLELRIGLLFPMNPGAFLLLLAAFVLLVAAGIRGAREAGRRKFSPLTPLRDASASHQLPDH